MLKRSFRVLFRGLFSVLFRGFPGVVTPSPCTLGKILLSSESRRKNRSSVIIHTPGGIYLDKKAIAEIRRLMTLKNCRSLRPYTVSQQTGFSAEHCRLRIYWRLPRIFRTGCSVKPAWQPTSGRTATQRSCIRHRVRSHLPEKSMTGSSESRATVRNGFPISIIRSS